MIRGVYQGSKMWWMVDAFWLFNHDIGAWDTAINGVPWWGGQLSDANGTLARGFCVYLVVGKQTERGERVLRYMMLSIGQTAYRGEALGRRKRKCCGEFARW
jgi:hypothetical protein